MVEELTNGTASRTYTYGLERISEYQPISGTWTPSFYQYDGGGNVRQLTNTAGAVTDRYEYDAFGNEFTVSGGSSTPNNYLYRGEQWDADLGLYYLRARYYNPLTGRFMSRDPNDGTPIQPESLHKYLYADGDPVNASDPNGRSALVEGAYVDLAKATSTARIAVGFGLDIAYAYCQVATTLAAYSYFTRTAYPLPKGPTVAFCLAAGWGRFGFPRWWGGFPGLG